MGSRGNFDHHGLRWALGSGYQFYTTSPTVQWAIDKKPETDFFPGGSSILVSAPTLVLNEQGFVDYEKTVIYAKAYGSTVERPNPKNENKWPYRGPTPPSLPDLNRLMTTEILPIKMAWQINGVPQYIYYDTLKIDSAIPLPLNKSSIKIQYALYNSWVQPLGQVYGQNAFFPNNFSAITDEKYDTSPARLNKSMTHKAPDSDWFGRSCVQEAYGQRFVIMYDAEGFWYCWPENSEVNISPYKEEYKTYGNQSYKANLKNRVPRVGCEYPEWAHPSISHRDAYKDDPDKVILDPRYSWSFNSTGTRAIGVMIERKDSECKFYQTNYAPEGLDFGWNVLLNRTEDGEPYIPTEVEIDPILLDRSEVLGGSSDPQKTQEDRLGIVELALTIVGNGARLEVSVINEKSPDALIALNKGTIVDIAYVAPLDWSRADGVGESLVDDVFGVDCDDIVSVWIELYRHEEQKWVVAAFDGEPSKLVPSKTVASFYKGLTFDTRIFRLPLSQSHGKGYSYSRDPDPEILPAPPHLFVWNPNATLASRYPFKPKEGCSDTLYYYGAKLEQLDLSTLSFYYTVRVVAQKKADVSYSTYPEATTILGEGVPGEYFFHRFTEDKYSINTKARTYCAVCAMGRVVEEFSVGNEDISDSWILGWIRKSTKDGLNDGEEKISPDLKGNFEGIGVFPYDEWTIGYPAGFIPPSRNIDSRNYSWQCTNYSNFDCGSVPWWLLGACGHIVKTAITMSIILYYDPTNYFEYAVYKDGYFLGYNTQTISFPPNHLWYYTKENISEFAELIFTSSQLGRYTYTWADGSDPLVVDGWGPYTKNPFTQARQGITLEDFVEQVKEYLWIIVKHVQDTTDKSVDILRCYDSYGYSYYPWNGHRSYNPGVMYFNIGFMSVLNEGGGLPAKKNGNVYTKDVSERVDKKITLKNFELGTLYYNTAISNHFYSSKMSVLSRIIVTPDGSISYLKKDVYEIKKEYAATAVVYQYSLNPYYTGEPTPIRLLIGDQTNDGYFIPDIELTADDIEWVLLDGLSWYYGRVKTKHLYVYNLAYQNKKNKRSLKHKESFVDKYSEADYKPDFRITEHGNMKWIYPGDSEDGYYKSLYHFSLPIGVEPNWNGNMTAPPNYHDPRQNITELRLSPIFF